MRGLPRHLLVIYADGVLGVFSIKIAENMKKNSDGPWHAAPISDYEVIPVFLSMESGDGAGADLDQIVVVCRSYFACDATSYTLTTLRGRSRYISTC